MARTKVTPELPSVVSFTDAGVRMPVRERRRGSGRRQQLRRMAGETKRNEVWQVRHATFTLDEGEALAIVGFRESGRQEILRLAAGTLVPDEGAVQRRVPVVPVISVGRALAKSYTVRQNIYLVGGLLGMTPDEVAERLPGIVKTAGVESVVDRYLGDTGGGIRVRLAWSIAMATEARAFAVSDVLVVGEPAFRERCWKTVEAKRADGVAFLVTTDRDADLLRFCQRALLLDNDTILGEMSVEEAQERLRTLKHPEKRGRVEMEELADEDDDELL